MSAAVHSDEGPQCPHCYFQFTADEALYFDAHRYTEDKCPECGEKFSVSIHIETSWICAPIEEEEKIP